MSQKQLYMDYILKTVEQTRANYEAGIESWKKAYDPEAFLGMFSGPGSIPQLAQCEAWLYRQTGERTYAENARRYLLEALEFVKLVPEHARKRHPEYEKGIPAFDTMFQGPHYTIAYYLLKDQGLFSKEEAQQIEHAISVIIDSLMHYPEWGTHNRCMLRVFHLSIAVKAVTPSEETKKWEKLLAYLAEESIGGWSIEDAALYQPLWIISGMVAEKFGAMGEGYYDRPQTRFYYEYLVSLMTPYGQIVDFGDTHFNSNWYLQASILETGASVYKCPRMKWAARELMEYGVRTQTAYGLHGAVFMTFAYEDADDTIIPQRPTQKSGPVMEDLVAKKVAFRSGWQPDDLYLLTTYRDEGDYGYAGREYLKTTISVRAEKAHHGHSDENSVTFLCKNQNVLLHDSGYRDAAPNGRYRSDIYHNRIVARAGHAPFEGVARNEAPFATPGQKPAVPSKEAAPLYDFIHDDGHYKPARTHAIHFKQFDGVEYSRNRSHMLDYDLVWDRSMVYLPKDDAFVVVDWVESQKDQSITLSNLWHAQRTLSAGENWADVQNVTIYRGPNDVNPYQNKTDLSLVVEFADGNAMGREMIPRNYSDSTMLYGKKSFEMKAGAREVFVTVLRVKKKEEDAKSLLGAAQILSIGEKKDSIGLVWRGSEAVYLCFKLDMKKGFAADTVYPRYTYQSGEVNYGRIHTDADFAFAVPEGDNARYGFVNGCRIYDGKKALFEVPLHSSYQFETGSWLTCDQKWRGWDGVIQH